MTKTFLAVAAFALLTSASLSGYAASRHNPLRHLPRWLPRSAW